MAQTRIGAMKACANRAGVSLEYYLAQSAIGLKWCYSCRTWHPQNAFYTDKSRYDGLSALCREARNRFNRARYTPHPATQYGPLPRAPRDGDKQQARQRVNVEVRTGKRPHPNTIPCTDCGHIWASGERRHEYDHYLGYAAAHHYDVQSVCTICHHQREEIRNGG